MDERLISILQNAQHVVVLTGAGISAESGIPTFRDALTGLWSKYEAEQLATPTAFERDPALVWNWYQWRRRMVEACQPNAGHRALVELAGMVPEFCLITQNVDGLHQAAGSTSVVQLHGNIRTSSCFDNRHAADQRLIDLIRKDDDEFGTGDQVTGGLAPPQCSQCDSLMRPDVVWFGESLNPDHLRTAEQAAATADVYFSIGTSSRVYPAAGLADVAIRNGATIVEINPDETPLSRRADFVLRGPAGSTLRALVDAMKRRKPS